jgi:hypothetical protein
VATSGSEGMKVALAIPRSPVGNARDLVVSTTIVNDGAESVRLNATFLSIPAIVLEVRDGSGRRVAPAPPPVPPVDDEEIGREVLEPGEALSFDYNGGALFGTTSAPGTYSVRFFYRSGDAGAGSDWHGTLESDWANFSLGGEA